MKLITILILCLAIFGCHQGRVAEREQSIPEDKRETSLPSYITNPPVSTAFRYYGTGSGSTAKSAEEAARASILNQIRVYIATEFRQVEQEIAEGERRYYSSFIEDRIGSLSYGRLPGIKTESLDRIGSDYFCLASLDRADFLVSQRVIQDRILQLLNGIDNERDAGLQLRRLVLTSSYLSQLLIPFRIDAEYDYVFFKNRIDRILNNLSFNVSVSGADPLTRDRTITVEVRSQGRVFSSVPLDFPTGRYVPNENGRIILNYIDYCPQYRSFTVRAAAEYIPIAPNLYPEEEAYARNLIRSFTRIEKAVYLECPQEYSIWLDVEYLVDGSSQNAHDITNRLKRVFSATDNWFVTTNRRDADINVEVSFDVNYSSTNEYLGICYKGNGLIRFRGKELDGHVIDLRDSAVAEETKSFHHDRNRAIDLAKDRLLEIMTTKIEEYTRVLAP
jgi:hypothetical protein